MIAEQEKAEQERVSLEAQQKAEAEKQRLLLEKQKREELQKQILCCFAPCFIFGFKLGLYKSAQIKGIVSVSIKYNAKKFFRSFALQRKCCA